MDIQLANPRGFCAGVDRAITIVERALEMFSPPVYVRHEVVHNKFVVDGLRDRGAVLLMRYHKFLMIVLLSFLPMGFLKPFGRKPLIVASRYLMPLVH